MNIADQLLQALSRTFLHSFWQGLVLSIVAGGIVLLTARTSSALRYRLLTASFFTFIAAIAFTFYHEWNAVAAGQDLLQNSSGSSTVSSILQQAWFRELSENLSELLREHSSWIVLAWSAIVLLKSAKMMLDLLYISRLRSQKAYSPIEEWKSRMHSLAVQIGVTKAVSLIESGMIKVPMVLGHLKPVILMPVGILNNMSEAEIEAVLLHELAHIRRHDYLVNFIQRIAECLLFFNPGLLWVSALMRVERENCCDDIAIAHTENRLQFAEALISFKKYSMNPQSYMIGFAGRKNVLLQRMTRIVYRKNTTLTVFELIFFALNISLLSLLLISKGEQENRVLAQSIEQVAAPQQVVSIAKELSQQDEKSAIEKPTPNPVKTKTVKQRPVAKQQIAASEADETQAMIELQEASAATETHATDQSISHAEQRRLAEIMRQEAERQRDLAAINRQIAEKHREEAAAFRKQAEEARREAEIARREAEVKRAEADIHRREAEVLRKRSEEDRHLAESRHLSNTQRTH
jgi:beta-lactamase regulating signal transducer with metallopeptidase domain